MSDGREMTEENRMNRKGIVGLGRKKAP